MPRVFRRERYFRRRVALPLEQLVGILVETHGLTDAVRGHCIYLYWSEMVGERLAAKTRPEAFSNGLLKVSTRSSAWMQELRFHRAEMMQGIDVWIDARRVWLGPPPLVTEIRFVLAGMARESVVEPTHVRRLCDRQLRRLQPPAISPADREAIRAETLAVEDAELRDAIERVRLKWNC